MNYKKIKGLTYEGNCTEKCLEEWDRLMQGAVRADKRKVNLLVKKYLPGFYEELCLNLNTYYKYYRTVTHLIVVHSAIEYFLRIEA